MAESSGTEQEHTDLNEILARQPEMQQASISGHEDERVRKRKLEEENAKLEIAQEYVASDAKRIKISQQMTSWEESAKVCEAARNYSSPIEYWSLLIPYDMISKIVDYTNKTLFSKGGTYYYGTTVLEMKSLIGLYYARGYLKSNTIELYEQQHRVFVATMREQRLRTLTCNLSFGDTPAEPFIFKPEEIQVIWQTFIDKCNQYYVPSPNCTIGEQSIRHERHTEVTRQFTENKFKFIMMNDVETGYMINAIMHTKDEYPFGLKTCRYVQELLKPIYGTGRNITNTVDWLTSVPIFTEMIENNSLSMIGIMKAKEDEISNYEPTSDDELFGDKDMRFVKYAHKKNEITLIVSSNQHCNESTTTAKINIKGAYNETSTGTDKFNHLCDLYTVVRETNRPSMYIWYSMLNQAYVNSFLSYNLDEEQSCSQESFLRELIHSLIQPFIDQKNNYKSSITVRDYLK